MLITHMLADSIYLYFLYSKSLFIMLQIERNLFDHVRSREMQEISKINFVSFQGRNLGGQSL